MRDRPNIYTIAARKLVGLTAVTCWSLGLGAGAVLGPAFSQSCSAQASPDDGRQRTTVQAWVGLPGVEETVAQIMIRTAEIRQQGINPRPSHRQRLAPPAPANAEPKVGWPTAIWPATGGPAIVAAPPVPESPQTPGANWLGATGGLDTEQPVDVFGVSPPDSVGEIGPNNYVVTINGLIRSFNRAGVRGAIDPSLTEFFASQLDFNEDTKDPHIRYNRLTARWFITAMSINNPNKILVAVSNGDTITVNTVFRFFHFISDAPNPAPASTNGFADYPTMGLATAGRLFTNAPGVTQSPNFPVTSTKRYNVMGSANERWGDYSSTRVDPRDDQTFWTIQEHTRYEDAWGVHVIKLNAAGPAIPLSASPSIIPPGRSDVNVVITGSTFGGRGWLETEPGLSQVICNFGAGITVNSISVLTPGQLRLSLTTGAGSVGPRSLTVTNPDGQTASSIGPIITIDPSADPGPIFPGGPPGFGCAAIVSGPGSGNPVCQGSTVTFSIVASGTPAPQYQWQRNGQNIPGAQLSSLTIRGVKSSDGGNYLCIVFNLCGPVISAARTLSVIGNPMIDSQPAGGTFAAGSSVQLTGAFSIANFPVVYWLKDGLEIVADGRITGVYTTTLSIANFNATDAGSYTMTVSAACGTTTSNAAVLAVGTASTCVADVASDSLDTTRNPDGSIGSEDLDAFISSFIAGCQ